MNRLQGSLGLLVLSCVLFTVPTRTHAWTIDDFASAIVLEQDGSVSVTETIKADFAAEEKHGIIRDIPVEYAGDQHTVYTTVTNVSVLQDAAPATVDTTRSGSIMSLRIGDAGRTIHGTHTYQIAYRVTGILKDFGTYDELNWNMTGNGWDAPIAHARASVTVPAETIQTACYKGPTGSKVQCDSFTSVASTTVFMASDLGAGEGLTVAVGYTHGAVPIIIITPPPTLTDALVSPITLGMTLVTSLVGLLSVLVIWWRHGRDRTLGRSPLPGVRSDRADASVQETIAPMHLGMPITVEYDPPDDLRPAEIGVLTDERADTLDVTATIVDLAARGYLTITEVPKEWLFGSADYTFTRTDKKTTGLLSYETLLLEHLFASGSTMEMSALKETFYKDLKLVKEALYADIVDKKLFAANPQNVRMLYIFISLAVFALGFIGCIIVTSSLPAAVFLALWHTILLGLSIGVCITAIVLLIASPYMPRKTGYGRELYQRALGYKMFVSGTEKYRAKFYEDQNLFVTVLPYAIVFGVTDKLARAFKDMGLTPPSPSWYHGSGVFNAALFAGSMHTFSQSMGSAMASAPSSSSSGGGGFSGGGFGGGGGGSW